MTQFMRYAALGTMAAGLSLCAYAQDSELDALLSGLDEEPAVEQAAQPADEEPAAAAEEPAAADEAAAEEPAAEEPAEEPAAEEPAAEEPAEEPAAEEPAEEPAAEEPAEEPAAEEAVEPAEEPAAEEPAAEEAVEPAAEEAVEPAEEPAEEETVEPAAEATGEEPTAEPAAVAPADEQTIAPEEGLLSDDLRNDNAPIVSEEDQKFNELEMLEKQRKLGLDKHAFECLMDARKLMTTKPAAGKAFDQYKEAISKYEQAQKFFQPKNENARYRSECDLGIREAKYRQANALYLSKSYKKALELAQEVTRDGHENGAKLVAMILEAMNKPAVIVPEKKLPRYAEDQYKDQRVGIDERMRRATVYFHVGDYEAARQQIELVLRQEPANESAISLRSRIAERANRRSDALKLATHQVMIDQVNQNWTPRGFLGSDSDELYEPKVSKGTKTQVDDQGVAETQKILAKLNTIRLPEFSIRPPSTLADAVDLFTQLSREYDKPELPPEERGISFVLNMGGAAPAAAASADADPFASDGGSSDGASASGVPPIRGNISVMWVTLKDALDTVTEVTGTKYIIKRNQVMIVPDGYVDGKMETRSYNVMSTFSDKIGQMSTEMSAGGGDAFSFGGSDSGSDSGSGSDSDSWKKLFMSLGVPFEGKASIIYLASVGKLRVTNTPENLALFENILEELNVTPYQIEVEARFVEVSQADLNSLGFEWQLNQNLTGTVGSGLDWASSAITGNTHGGASAGGIGAGDMPVFRHDPLTGTADNNFAVHGGANAVNQGMRFLGDGSVYANRINLSNSSVAPNDTFASFSAVFGKMDMTMILHMLAQRTDTDMLSSPKVLARPGQEALIRVVTEWIYPTEFSITELDESDTNYSGDATAGVSMNAPPVKFAVEPQSFEKQEVGVSLQVVPEVSQEGQMINLLVNPKVVEYLGDFDYGMDVPYIQYTMNALGVTTGAEVQYYHVSMPQPKFHFREISTYLSVYNGSTVVMGGLITEKRNSFEDKVPILGDLPFIGFLFRSKGEYSDKRNLLIFLTARLVDPSGRPLKTATDGRTGNAAMDSRSSESTTMGAAAK